MEQKLFPNSNEKLISESDIDYIKKHLRYPINSFQKYKPFIMFFVMINFIALCAYFLVSVEDEGFTINTFLRKAIPFSGAVIAICVGFYKFYKSLFFDKIKTNYSIEDNMTLLTNFFMSNHFKYYVMNEHHEIFMMQSNAIKGSNQQEVVIFIAVNKEILINSHITTSNIFLQHKRKVNELKKLFVKYVDENKYVGKEIITL